MTATELHTRAKTRTGPRVPLGESGSRAARLAVVRREADYLLAR